MTRQTKANIFGALFLACVVGLCVLLGWLLKVRPQHRYDEFIKVAAQRYNLDPALIKAVIWQESRFDQYARGKAGEIGLMQVCEPAAFEWADHEKFRSFDHEEITDPQKNILCGTFYLSKLMKRYTQTDNPLPYALADYNAGRTHVLRWNKGAAKTNSAAFLAQMDYAGTRQYALNIMKQYEHYKKERRIYVQYSHKDTKAQRKQLLPLRSR
jgi:soluble lytic murein transglycosylase